MKISRCILLVALGANVMMGPSAGAALRGGGRRQEHDQIEEDRRLAAHEEVDRVLQAAITAPSYTMPPEDAEHEGTWLAWPHSKGWGGPSLPRRYDPIWVAMAAELSVGENVHIVVYNNAEKARVTQLLKSSKAKMNNIDFYVYPTDDVWIRDNGPIFARKDNDEKMTILDWEFNGWGEKADYFKDDVIPTKVGNSIGVPVQDVPMVLEGGSFEVDGNGALLAKKSSIINNNRNPGWSRKNIEKYLKHFLGVDTVIWLPGEKGMDITDDHIDGTARFANGDTIITMPKDTFFIPSEYNKLKKAKNSNGQRYDIVELPMTQRKPRGLSDYGTYINFYAGNEVILVPAYGDPNDAEARRILQEDVYKNKKRAVSIDITELYKDGGMIHCVTQQQPK